MGTFFTYLYLILQSMLHVKRIRLSSANRHQLIVPRHHRANFGRRVFTVAGPTAWNSLPDFLRDGVIHRLVKTLLAIIKDNNCLRCTGARSALEALRNARDKIFYLLTYFITALHYSPPNGI